MRAAAAAPVAPPGPAKLVLKPNDRLPALALLPARLDPAARIRCFLILAGEWRRVLAGLPGWEDDILQVIAPGNAGRDMGPR